MQKQEQEAARDLKNTLTAPSNENNRFLIDLGSILGPFWVPKSMPASEMVSKIEQKSSKSGGGHWPDRGLGATIGPRIAFGCPKWILYARDPIRDPFWHYFGSDFGILGPFLDGFSPLGPPWARFWTPGGPFWNYLGAILYLWYLEPQIEFRCSAWRNARSA